MVFESKNLVLLTGAGFTKNFNGFLGSEMWSKVFNHPIIQKNQKLRSLLQYEFDFESLYSRVRVDTGLSKEDNLDFQNAVEGAYKSLDDAIRNWVFNLENPTALDTYKLYGELFGLLNDGAQKPGFIFTLNQDLLLERKRQMRAIGAPPFPQQFYLFDGRKEFSKEFFIRLPNENIDEALGSAINNNPGPHYVKLHGSFGWKSFDGSNQMVLGKNKWDALRKEPLLFAYFNLFKEVIKEGNKQLLVIGYGFKDDHINSILLDGIKNHGLRLYIITAMSIEEFEENLSEADGNATMLKNGLSGFFPYRLNEIFPPNQEGSVHLEEIKRSLKM